jgi:glycerol kinase
VWQCRRSAGICAEHRERDEEAMLHRRTGLLLDPYFTATKIEWLLRAEPELRLRAERGEICASTVDCWLIARLTRGRVLATDASNASRTLLFDLARGGFDPELCALFGVPDAALPEVRDTAGAFGVTDPGVLCGLELPITGVAGDQQAALFGQACVRPGMSKNTYGTGSFVLTNVGDAPPAAATGVLATVAWRVHGADVFALEGSIFVTGAALRWLVSAGVLETPQEAEALFVSVPDTAGCYFVPALSGLGAPWWDPDARGAFLGLSGAVRREHLVRAVVESMAYRTRDVVEAMEASSGLPFKELRVDGGASRLDALCQFQADLLGIPVTRSASPEATALGAGMLAALGAGLIDGTDAVEGCWAAGKRFEPASPGARPMDGYSGWLRALQRVRTRESSGDKDADEKRGGQNVIQRKRPGGKPPGLSGRE